MAAVEVRLWGTGTAGAVPRWRLRRGLGPSQRLRGGRSVQQVGVCWVRARAGSEEEEDGGSPADERPCAPPSRVPSCEHRRRPRQASLGSRQGDQQPRASRKRKAIGTRKVALVLRRALAISLPRGRLPRCNEEAQVSRAIGMRSEIAPSARGAGRAGAAQGEARAQVDPAPVRDAARMNASACARAHSRSLSRWTETRAETRREKEELHCEGEATRARRQRQEHPRASRYSRLRHVDVLALTKGGNIGEVRRGEACRGERARVSAPFSALGSVVLCARALECRLARVDEDDGELELGIRNQR